MVTVADAVFTYGNEYLGNGLRLVITPLTDRIYVTATQALNLKMGCAPAGPAGALVQPWAGLRRREFCCNSLWVKGFATSAPPLPFMYSLARAPVRVTGTGKTETTKDLASALGKACYVFNCSPEMDYQSMGNIFKGLAASGSWGCFDEFNRLVRVGRPPLPPAYAGSTASHVAWVVPPAACFIPSRHMNDTPPSLLFPRMCLYYVPTISMQAPEVLSVCSVQFKAVCDAIRGNRPTVKVEGDEVNLDATCGTFITMNPGYLGRSELPEGLKTLFRPITVMVPDLVLICENMLMAEGFAEAKLLAYKFYGLYSLLGELLSKQVCARVCAPVLLCVQMCEGGG